jgi:hypothetical protein
MYIPRMRTKNCCMEKKLLFAFCHRLDFGPQVFHNTITKDRLSQQIYISSIIWELEVTNLSKSLLMEKKLSIY